jgi:hypothetical protein
MRFPVGCTVSIQIEPDGGRGDDLNVEIGQRQTGCCRDAFEASGKASTLPVIGFLMDS